MIKKTIIVSLVASIFVISGCKKDDKVSNTSKKESKENVNIKNHIPQPVFQRNPEFVDLYWKAWEIAYSHIKEQSGLIQSPYVDEAFWDDTIWIWDTEFMVLFCKYAPQLFPGIESLNNFYGSILDKKPSPLKIQHPDNPPFFAWVESEYFKFTNDKNHISKLINNTKYLQRHYEWFDALKPGTKLHFKHSHIAIEKKKLGYKWGGVQSGMDNTPRGRKNRNKILWIDAIAQQALAAKNIVELAKVVGNTAVADKFQSKYNELKAIVNNYYWDETDGFYYDIDESTNEFVKVKTPASYWVLLAELASEEQAQKMAEHALNPDVFGGDYPWPTVSRDDKDYNNKYGDYWRGGIWLPTGYMATKALEKYGKYEVADKNAFNLVKLMSETYRKYKPATIWECYSPSEPAPSHRVFGEKLEEVRPDFCGWSALGPISMLIENILGFHHVDAQTNTVKWRLHQTGKHGIKQLRFGNVLTDIIYDGSNILVKTNNPFTLIINGKSYNIQKGENKLSL